jgi:hypothetical protein
MRLSKFAVLSVFAVGCPPSAFAGPDGGDPWNSAGVRITDAAEAARLRELRAGVYVGYPGAPDPVWVSTGDGGAPYAAYIRDDVPENMRRAVEAIWSRQPRGRVTALALGRPDLPGELSRMALSRFDPGGLGVTVRDTFRLTGE